MPGSMPTDSWMRLASGWCLWDLPPDEIQSLEDRGETQRTMLFRAPVGGFVIDKHLIRGQHVTPGMSLYTVADLSAVWVEAEKT